MVIKPQQTKFQLFVVENFNTLSSWASNPWRRYSLSLIIFLIGYLLGSTLGMVSAVYDLVDPVGALVSLLIIELLIGLRRVIRFDKTKKLGVLLSDFLRIGLCYGFFTEGLKLL